MSNSDILFLPVPRILKKKGGFFNIEFNSYIQVNTPKPYQHYHIAAQLKTYVQREGKTRWQITASKSIPEEQIAVELQVDPTVIENPQGYYLTIKPDRICIKGADKSGLFYGVQTLKQIISQAKNNQLNCVEIYDWPDFPDRGIMLDISRDKVYRINTLLTLIDQFASWKINQLQLYTEHTFTYLGHEVVWRDSSPMTPEDILQLDQYCRDRYIELVPNQNSFGHMSRWLKHPQYQHLAETLEPIQTPWGHIQKEPFSLSPVLHESLRLISGLYDQLLPNFSSKMINVGCDETFDIGMGKSKGAVNKKGKGQVYLDYLMSLDAEVRRRGYTMQFWGDIILQHPELIPQLPKDIIALNWGYEKDHPFEQEAACFNAANVPFYVCPGTSSWNSIGGRIDNMLENCLHASRYGLINAATGYLNTDWGDNGHWQQLPISYPGFTAGAAYAWCLESNQDMDLERVLNHFVFKDSSKAIGKILLEIGNEYKAWGLNIPNSSPLFWMLQEPAENLQQYALDDPRPIYKSLERLAFNLQELDKATPGRHDALLLKDEIRFTIRMIQFACRRSLNIIDSANITKSEYNLCEINGLISDFITIWLKRNRPGGLTDSLARFNHLQSEYEAVKE